MYNISHLEALEGGGTTGRLVRQHATDRAPEHARGGTVVDRALLRVRRRALVQELQELDLVAHVCLKGRHPTSTDASKSAQIDMVSVSLRRWQHRGISCRGTRRCSSRRHDTPPLHTRECSAGVSARSDFCMFERRPREARRASEAALPQLYPAPRAGSGGRSLLPSLARVESRQRARGRRLFHRAVRTRRAVLR